MAKSWPFSDPSRPAVTVLPLGFGTGQWNDIKHLALSFQERAHTWAFVGHMKSDRPQMLAAFSRVPGGYPAHSAHRSELLKIYGNSWFVAGTRGWSLLEVFRIDEALCVTAPSLML